jgi:hypothetical protein
MGSLWVMTAMTLSIDIMTDSRFYFLIQPCYTPNRSIKEVKFSKCMLR